MNKVKLGSVCEITSSKRIHASDYVSEGIPFYRGKEIIQLANGTKINNPLFISNSKYCEITKKFGSVNEGDILLTAVGTIGIPYLVKERQEFYFKDGNVVWLKLNKDSIVPKYLYYLIKSDIIKEQVNKNLIGTSQKALTLESLKEIEISLLSLREQQKIASILSALDDQIELNNKINQELEELAQTLYNYWFVQFEFPNDEGKPYKSSGGKMVWNEELKREIPEGWEVKRLGEELMFERGVEPGSKNYKTSKGVGDIKFYRVSDMETDSFTYISSDLAVEKVINENDVVVSFDGTLGRIGIGLNGAYSTGMRKIYDSNNVFNNALIYFIFKDNTIQNIIRKYATGTNILHASVSIKHLLIPYDKKTFKLFKDKVTDLFNEILLGKKQNQEIAQFRDYLLPLLMNGQVTVSDDLIKN